MTMELRASRYPSPLRYPGGKGKVANFIKILMMKNGLIGSDYVEPFAGGASIALALLFEDYVDEIHINDLNPAVYAFWHTVLYDTTQLCDRIEKTPVTMKEWHRQRAVYTSLAPAVEDLGFATFFLNRTNRSGIVSGGVIGGVDQTGPWKIDARYNTPELANRIRKVGRHRSRVHVTQEDGAAFLERWTKDTCPQALLYLDPPYFVKGEGLYDNFYTAGDHQNIAKVVDKLVNPWVVSYDAVPEVMDLYGDFSSLRYGLSYSAHTAGKGNEVMFFSPGLDILDVHPAGISSGKVARARTEVLERTPAD